MSRILPGAMPRAEVMRRWIVIGVPLAWLLVFFIAPFAIVVKLSLSDPASAMPPYRPVFDLSAGFQRLIEALGQLDIETFGMLLADDLYVQAFLGSLAMASMGALFTLLVGFPIAYAIARAPKAVQGLLLMLVILPFWTSFLIRVYAWIAILKPEGLLNLVLQGIGLIGAPLEILNTNVAVQIGIVYAYLPFMILPIYAALERQDPTLLDAAADLGCGPVRAFWRVTVPLAMPGILAGALLVFIPAMGEFIIPDLLGGSDTLMVGRTLWVEFFNNRDWPLASAVAVVLLVLLIGPILLHQWLEQRQDGKR
jgi:putrescine transport system permease protein